MLLAANSTFIFFMFRRVSSFSFGTLAPARATRHGAARVRC